MSDLTKCLTPEEEIHIENKLRELYSLQDRPIKREQFELMLHEIIGSGKPFAAMIAGIVDLKIEDLRKLSYPIIMGAIFKHCEKDSTATESCEHCCSSGFMVMKDDEGRSFSMACICRNGEMVHRQGNVRWRGKVTQFSNGRELTVY